jgi:hypothetical protein
MRKRIDDRVDPCKSMLTPNHVTRRVRQNLVPKPKQQRLGFPGTIKQDEGIGWLFLHDLAAGACSPDWWPSLHKAIERPSLFEQWNCLFSNVPREPLDKVLDRLIGAPDARDSPAVGIDHIVTRDEEWDNRHRDGERLARRGRGIEIDATQQLINGRLIEHPVRRPEARQPGLQALRQLTNFRFRQGAGILTESRAQVTFRHSRRLRISILSPLSRTACGTSSANVPHVEWRVHLVVDDEVGRRVREAYTEHGISSYGGDLVVYVVGEEEASRVLRNLGAVIAAHGALPEEAEVHWWDAGTEKWRAAGDDVADDRSGGTTGVGTFISALLGGPWPWGG